MEVQKHSEAKSVLFMPNMHDKSLHRRDRPEMHLANFALVQIDDVKLQYSGYISFGA